MRAYFDLCSEEYYLWQQGNLSKEVWKEWKSGIEFAFSKTAFRQAWEHLQLDTKFYGKFGAFVAQSIGPART